MGGNLQTGFAFINRVGHLVIATGTPRWQPEPREPVYGTTREVSFSFLQPSLNRLLQRTAGGSFYVNDVTRFQDRCFGRVRSSSWSNFDVHFRPGQPDPPGLTNVTVSGTSAESTSPANFNASSNVTESLSGML